MQSSENLNKRFICGKFDIDSGQLTDMSFAVQNLRFSASYGTVSTMKLDLVDGVISLESDTLTIDIDETLIRLGRNDYVVVLEVTDNDFEHALILMIGRVVDFLVAKTASSRAVSIQIDNPLAELDSMTTINLVSTRSTACSLDSLLLNPTDGSDVRTLWSQIREKYKSIGAVDADVKVGTEPASTLEKKRQILGGRSGTTILASAFTKNEGAVDIDPWPLVRDILLTIVEVYISNFKRINSGQGVTDEELDERFDTMADLLYRIEGDIHPDGTNALLTFSLMSEYEAFVDYVANTILSTSGRHVSIWQLITSIMADVYIYFTPYILYPKESLRSGICYGRFMNCTPYREPSVYFGDDDIHQIDTALPNHSGLIRAVGFGYQGPPDWAPGAYDQYAGIAQFMPTTDDWLETPLDVTYRLPALGVYKEINLPPWLPYTGNAASYAVRNKLKSIEEALKPLGDTMLRFLGTAWAVHGRKNMTAALSMISSVPIGLLPLSTVLCSNAGSFFYGLVSSVSIDWKQGVSYDKTIQLTHITSTKDPYYQPLKHGLYVPMRLAENVTFSE